MKYLAIISLLLLSFCATAQTANFKSSNAKHEAGIHTQFNFSLTSLGGTEQFREMERKMRATPGILKLDVLDLTPSSVNLIIITDQKNDVLTVQNAFAAAGIKQVVYDNKKVKGNNLEKVLTTKK